MTIAFILILIHYIADFIMQDEEMALNKSKSLKVLLKHSWKYTFTFFIAFGLLIAYQIYIGCILEDIKWLLKMLLFFPITFICHATIDYITSRIVKKKFENKEYYFKFSKYNFPKIGAFPMIGFDQLLHYATLFLTYYYLTH